jgi:uncharacterized RDD family membrane protein YckC
MTEKYPELLDRIQSTFIDAILLIVLMVIFASMLDRLQIESGVLRGILFVLLFIAYEPLCMTMGCTLGNYMKGIRVRKYSNSSQKINFFQAIIRYPVKALLGWISFITIHSNPEKRAIHDIVSGSVMIKL